MMRSTWLFGLLPLSLAACGGNTAVTTDNAGGSSPTSSTDVGGSSGSSGSSAGGSSGSSAGGSSGSSAGGSSGSSTGGSSGSSTGGTNTGGTGVGGMPSSSAWDWVFGSPGDDNARGVAVDSGGNAVVLGNYLGKIDLQGTTFQSNMIDMFLAKVDTDGKLVWAKTFGTDKDDRGVLVDINPQGQIFVAGSFGDLMGNFGGDPYNGTGPVFAKLAPDGTCLWTKAWILNGSGSWGGIVADPDGSSWVTGVFNGSVNFGSGAKNSSGTLDPFIAHLDVNGGEVGFATVAGNANFRGQAADGKGGLFVSGTFKGTLDLGSGPLTSADPMVADSFIAQLDSKGKALWAKKLPGVVQRVTVDASGNDIVTGYFSGMADFGTGSMLASTGADDIYVLALDAAGKPLWAKHFGATSPDAGRALGTDSAGNIYVTGFFSGAPDFGMGPLIVGMQHNALVMKLDSTGKVLGAKGFGGDGNEEGLYTAVDSAGSAFAWGELDGPGNYGSGVKTPVGMKDVFLVKVKF